MAIGGGWLLIRRSQVRVLPSAPPEGEYHYFQASIRSSGTRAASRPLPCSSNPSLETPIRAVSSSVPGTSSRCAAMRPRSRPPKRSEERRVGKECRSRCDWSSDVCSSDLLVESLSGDADQGGIFVRSGDLLALRRDATQVATAEEIGRASCRERV